MDFETYLKEKKIDPVAFKQNEPRLWSDFKHVFMQVHPKSFTAQKLYQINPIRRKYPFKEEAIPERGGAGPKKAGKPVMKPKQAKPKAAQAKPNVAAKPKIKPKTTGAKPKIKPKPVIKKPKTD